MIDQNGSSVVFFTMNDAHLLHQKSILRSEILNIRRKLSAEEKKSRQKKIISHIYQLNDFKKVRSIACYYSIDNEVDTKILIKDLLNKEYCVYLPKIENNKMCFAQIKNMDDLQLGKYDIHEPTGNILDSSDYDDIDLWFLPGVAFDHQGVRLGFGKGYYDQFLEDTSIHKRIGLCYDFQFVDYLPCSGHDQKVSRVITEDGLHQCIGT